MIEARGVTNRFGSTLAVNDTVNTVITRVSLVHIGYTSDPSTLVRIAWRLQQRVGDPVAESQQSGSGHC
jgi:hypothetical protein